MTLTRRMALVVAIVPAAVVILYALAPVAFSVRMSFKSFGFFTGISDVFTTSNYQQVLTQPYYTKAWVNSVVISLESAAITACLGAFVAYVLWRIGGHVRSYMTAILIAPLLVSGVVRAYGWLAIGGPGGLIPKTTSMLGLGHWLLYGNGAALLVAFVHIFLPFMVIMVLTSLDSISPSILRAAANLGANELAVAVRVVLPNVYSTIMSGFLLVFALGIASYAIPDILGAGRIPTIAQVMYLEQNFNANWPRAAALAVSLTVVTLAVMTTYQLILRRLGKTMSVVEV
jgi:putative spermidine/putrescine transport system permease protein